MKCRVFNDQPAGTPECGQDATHVAIRYGTHVINQDPKEWERTPGGYGAPAGEGYVRAFPVCADHVEFTKSRGDQVVAMDRATIDLDHPSLHPKRH